jgi:YtkA-like
MNPRYLLAPAFAVAMSLISTAALAGANDYTFEAVAAELKKGDDVIVAVRLLHKLTGKPVTDAVIVRARVDMAPDGMADMESPVVTVPANEPGVYAFKTDLSMAGRWLLSVAAKVQGEPETVIGKIVFKAIK